MARDVELTGRVRGLLERLVDSERLSKDEREQIADAVLKDAAALPRDGVLEAVERAVGKSKKRRRVCIYLLGEFTDVPAVAVRVGEWLRSPDPEWRSWLIQVIEQRGLRQYASILSEIASDDPDAMCRDLAIHAAGTLRAPECLPSLLRLAVTGSDAHAHALAWALKDYAIEECRPHLTRYFESNSKQLRVVAAWGLAKLKDRRALDYLIQMLDDPDDSGPMHSHPGESMRAAQALCDVLGWPFEWNRSYVVRTKERLATNGAA